QLAQWQTGGPSKSCGWRIQSCGKREGPEWLTDMTAAASRFLVNRRVHFPSKGRRNL
ncbi:hypothetical protein CDAR_559791, partial [Caerostris darwini]